MVIANDFNDLRRFKSKRRYRLYIRRKAILKKFVQLEAYSATVQNLLCSMIYVSDSEQRGRAFSDIRASFVKRTGKLTKHRKIYG